jgi:hypothetical protein
MPRISRLLVTDNPAAEPRHGEAVVLLRGRTVAEAVELVGAGPAEIRIDLGEDALRFLAQVASVNVASSLRAA